MNLTEKIIASRTGRRSVYPGETLWIDIDYFLTHDVFGADTFSIFEREFSKNAAVWDPGRAILFTDHYIFTEDKLARRNVARLDNYAKKYDIVHFYPPFTEKYKGVCHVAIAEEGFTIPGSIIVGTDSHTVTAGAFGLFATGLGNTDGAFVLATGRQWFRVPETIKIDLTGEKPDYIMAKDIILSILGRIGTDGATYKAIEFGGDALIHLSMDERMTLCNMVVEAGAKNGVVPADPITRSYFSNREIRSTAEYLELKPDLDARYSKKIEFNLESLEPVVAAPHSPDKTEPARMFEGTQIQRCYIGSCTGGKIADLYAAARILKDRETRIPTYIVPATVEVQASLEHLEIGGFNLREIFTKAGCRIGPPTCGACLGGPTDTFGRAQAFENVISTTNRNFPGRMGSAEAKIYLASPLTVASSAITGKIVDPRDWLQ